MTTKRNTLVAGALAALMTLVVACPIARGQEAADVSPAEKTAELLSVLQSDADLNAKEVACQELAIYGTPEALPVLTDMLSEPKLAHYARFALESMPYDEVDAALRKALDQLDGQLLVGVINSIRNRRDAEAVGKLKGFLSSDDPEVAMAAVAALGEIATADVAEPLRQSLTWSEGPKREAAGDAVLTCAEHLANAGERDQAIAMYDAATEADLPDFQQIAATRGAILVRGEDGKDMLVDLLGSDDPAMFDLALKLARILPGSSVTEALTSAVSDLPESRATMLLLALGDRGDRAALDTLASAAKSDSAAMRASAVRAMGSLQDPKAAPQLLSVATSADGELAAAARQSVGQLRGEGVDEAVLEQLEDASGSARVALIEIAGARRIGDAVPTLMEAAQSSDAATRQAAIEALGGTIRVEQLPLLIRQLIDSQGETAEAWQQAIKAACWRLPERAQCAEALGQSIQNAPDDVVPFLMDQLQVVSGPEALDVVERFALGDDRDLQNEATRVLGKWLSVDAAPVLLAIAKDSSHPYSGRCLSGYIRLYRQFDMPADQKVTMARTALALADRVEVKSVALESVGRIASPAALALAVSYLSDADLREPAAQAAVATAEQIVAGHKQAVAEAMQKVLDASVSDDTKRKARSVLNKAK